MHGIARADGLPASCEQRLAMTSFAFMFVLVPEPVWKISSGKMIVEQPSMISSAACAIRPARRRVEFAEFEVGLGGSPFDQAQRPDEFPRETVGR